MQELLLLREVVSALNQIPRKNFNNDAGRTNTYQLASKIDKRIAQIHASFVPLPSIGYFAFDDGEHIMLYKSLTNNIPDVETPAIELLTAPNYFFKNISKEDIQKIWDTFKIDFDREDEG